MFVLFLLLRRVVLLGRVHEERRELLHEVVLLFVSAVLVWDVEREEDDGSHCERELRKNMLSDVFSNFKKVILH